MFQRSERGSEAQLDELKRENTMLKENLLEKLTKDLNDAEISNEVRRVKDPTSFSALKSILTSMNRMKLQVQEIKKEASGEPVLKGKLNECLSKNKEQSSEIKTLRKKIEQLNTQNEFLLNELEFAQKKGGVAQKKPAPDSGAELIGNFLSGKNAKSENQGQAGKSDFYKECVKEICEILNIVDETKLVGSIQIIEAAYQLLPALQTTVESVFKIVSEGNIFDTPINSYDDISSTVDSWSTNLMDYKNLVNGLIEILEIEDESQRTVSFILETVSDLRTGVPPLPLSQRRRSHSSKGSAEGTSEILMILKEMLRVNSDNGLLDSVAGLQKQVQSMDDFITVVKEKMNINRNFSEESTFSKIIRFIDVNIEK